MTRQSKVEEIRSKCPKKTCGKLTVKTGPKQEKGFKEHVNALSEEMAKTAFIPKIR